MVGGQKIKVGNLLMVGKIINYGKKYINSYYKLGRHTLLYFGRKPMYFHSLSWSRL
jgi:hypothetical protein